MCQAPNPRTASTTTPTLPLRPRRRLRASRSWGKSWLLRRVSTKPQRFQVGSAGSAGCGLLHSLTVLCVVKSIGPIGFALWGWLFQTPCFVLVSKMILVASILYDVYAVYVTLFQQVLKMHGSCLPTQLFVLLLKASESSEKEASRRQMAQRKKRRSRRASFSGRGRRRYAINWRTL